jgi:hypothetical protein
MMAKPQPPPVMRKSNHDPFVEFKSIEKKLETDDDDESEEESELINQFTKLQFSTFTFGKLHQQISDVLIFFQK